MAVVGAGPAGAAAAYWLASAGWDVVLVEAKQLPRAKTCGDGLTPRAVRQLQDMGLAEAIAKTHAYRGLRAVAFGRQLELPWPEHPEMPSEGRVVTRVDLDILVAERARAAGASLRTGQAARLLRDEHGEVAGVLAAAGGEDGRETALVTSYVVVADGANSRIGRDLGASRARTWPLGMALRSYWSSPRASEPWLESHLELRDDDGALLPGYGWIFPLGDGRVNVGVGLLSTSGRSKGANTTKLLERFVRSVAEPWGLDAEAPLQPPTGGKLPMGLSVGPAVGTRHVLAGDAAGSVNPFNGEGIAYGYESGRLAAWGVALALSGDRDGLRAYGERLQATYGDYFRLARGFVGVVGHPWALRAVLGAGMRSEHVMGPVVRVMANLMRPDDAGPGELAYRALRALMAA